MMMNSGFTCTFLLLFYLANAVFPVSAELCKNANILIIGDSNTERGTITGPLRAIIRGSHDDFGTGYLALNEAQGYGFMPQATSVINGPGWIQHDAYENNTRLAPPYPSPNGMWVTSSSPGAVTTVMFPGNRIDVYWCTSSPGGQFSITIDSTIIDTINTAGTHYQTSKISIPVTPYKVHLMELTCISGEVILLGFDAKNDVAAQPYRGAVHTWANGTTTTQDFVGVDSIVFESALKEVSPDVVAILLGTNDHNLDLRPADEFKANLIRIINRIKKGTGHDRILLVSTFETNTTEGRTLLPEYVNTSFPEAASETGTEYWNLYEWYGPYNSNLMADRWHCNEQGGAQIADGLWTEISTKFQYSPCEISMGPLKNWKNCHSFGKNQTWQTFTITGRLTSELPRFHSNSCYLKTSKHENNLRAENTIFLKN